MSREQRARMSETYVAVADALARAVVPTVGVVLDRLPALPRPAYLPEPAPPRPMPAAAARAAMDALIARGRRPRPS